MFYRPEDGHGLPHNPFNAVISPRPIGWISTRAGGQDNLAPYSFFNAVAYEPPQLMFASTSAKADRGDTKDSVSQIRQSGVFCVNVVRYDARDAMNASSAPLAADADEFAVSGALKAECESIDCPRVADAPAALECRVTRILRMAGAANYVVFGEVKGVHLNDACIVDGIYDVTRYSPLARMGYRDYAQVAEVFSLNRPGE